ncbi:hypothetical protein [Paraburkholderia sp.]|uniref:hypothetical protein n=1 Tax=Paraburkholderia sp. TaxID=1926495 RepID=UPI00238E353D|nr:hypothetical protein [Paraburkholderia sp.]MDE1179458.1 hypothetical protein [Paraburkholderia sp.]
MTEPKVYPPPKMVDRKCKWCRKPFQARAVDVKRGWGLFCSKSCKAMKQEKRTHQFKNLQHESSFPDGRYDRDMSDWERREIQHERDLHESTTSHGQDGTGGW